MNAPVFITFNGVTLYDAQRKVKFMLKSSGKNIKLKDEYLPVLATLEEANAYGLKHGLGTFFSQSNGQQTEDSDFDAEAFLLNVKKRKGVFPIVDEVPTEEEPTSTLKTEVANPVTKGNSKKGKLA